MENSQTNVFLTPIEYLKGIGPRRAMTLKNELGIYNAGDLLTYYPFRYVDKSRFYTVSQLRQMEDVDVQVVGRLGRVEEVRQGLKVVRMTATLSDGTGVMQLVWFKGFSWIKRNLKEGENYVVYGRVSIFAGRVSMAHPEMETQLQYDASPMGTLVPVYSSTEKTQKAGITQRLISTAIHSFLEQWDSHIHETLSRDVLQENNLMGRREAIRNIHFPIDNESLSRARYRMKFEELFYMQMAMVRKKIARANRFTGYKFAVVGRLFNEFYAHHLSFELTGAQKRVIKEIRRDVNTGNQMNRLVQGDVGSGKTVVALMSMLMALDNGYQACMMAPTEILATQHYNSISRMVEGMGIHVELLTGSTRAVHRRKILEGLQNGDIHIVVGTHALIEDTVVFKNLALAVIDEQHRFGVEQRSRLWGKSAFPPHVLVMTATPIPRTLAMTVYGDLDVSIIDELPAGRRPVQTLHRYEQSRLGVLGFMKGQIDKGRQVYVVYPLIEESEGMDYKNLIDGYTDLDEYFERPAYNVEVVHGRMKAEEKDAIIERFSSGVANILVSTTVIEVGVDIPNATVMVIESAERFGLAQLHQLRGRVGRGREQSYCILMTGDKLSDDARRRMEAMVSTTDGFKIAELDMKLRGWGDMMGVRQSGMANLKIADLTRDADIMAASREVAQKILFNDPDLLQPHHEILRRSFDVVMKGKALWGYIS